MAVVVSDDQAHVLLLRRELYFLWDLPGGGIEKSERPADAAIRETDEETGYRVAVDRYVGRYLHQSVYGRGDQETFAFRTHLVGGTPKNFGLEVTGLSWRDPAQLPRTLEPLHRQIIADALAPETAPVERRIDFALWKLYPARVIFFLLRVVNEGIKIILRRKS